MSARSLRIKLILLFILAFLGVGIWGAWTFATLPDERILGEWRVDTAATLAEWRKHKQLTPAREQFWARTWEDVQITYYPDRYTTRFRETAARSFYKVRSRGQNEIVIREKTRSGAVRDITIQFDGPDRIWIPNDAGPELRQCLYRVKEGTQRERTQAEGLAAAIGG